jgi:PPOX class probable F420-dependent enzyme
VDAGGLRRDQLRFLEVARRAVLATIAPDGHVRLVPICFAIESGDEPGGPLAIWSPLDEKPKSTADPLSLARVRDIVARPAVTLLAERWSEDWSELGWVRVRGTAAVAGPDHPGHQRAVAALRERYPQYAGHALEVRPMLRIAIQGATSWGNLGPAGPDGPRRAAG